MAWSMPSLRVGKAGTMATVRKGNLMARENKEKKNQEATRTQK